MFVILQVTSLTEERKLLQEEKMAFAEQVMNLSETLQQSESMKQQMHKEKVGVADMLKVHFELTYVYLVST